MSSFAPSGNISKVYMVGRNRTKWVKINATIDAVSLFGGASNVNAGSMTTIGAIVPNTYLAYNYGADLSGASSTMAAANNTEIIKQENNALDEIGTTVYPNPLHDRIFVADSRKIRQVSVFDLVGSRLIAVGQTFKNGIDVHNLPTGTYIVNVEDEKEMARARKIIINK